jgi:hypothetical protein
MQTLAPDDGEHHAVFFLSDAAGSGGLPFWSPENRMPPRGYPSRDAVRSLAAFSASPGG